MKHYWVMESKHQEVQTQQKYYLKNDISICFCLSETFSVDAAGNIGSPKMCMCMCILRARVQPTLDPYAEAFL